MAIEETLKKLAEAYGPSGEEEEVRLLIKEEIGSAVDQMYEDTFGNLYAIRNGGAGRIMISAHMDEIGIIITDIDDRGFLRLAPLGGISPRLMVGQRLRFRDGTIGTVYHEKLNSWKDLDWPKLYVDVGFSSSDSRKYPVKIGDLACLAQPFVKQHNGRFMAKSMDDRAGCAVLIEVIKQLSGSLPHEVCFLFSAQEELGLRGAKTAAYRYDPDYGLAVDVTLVGDTPEAPTMAVSLGKGPAIKVRDNSLFCHPRIRQLICDTAEKNSIPYQLEVLTRGGTDAGAIHVTREGVPSGAISIPCRYVHSASEIIDGKDLKLTVLLVEKLLQGLWPQIGGSNLQ
jgi:endoglucanase